MRYSFEDAYYTDDKNLGHMFTIPKPLSINQLYGTNRYGSKYVSEKGEHWFKVAGDAIMTQRLTSSPTKVPLSLSMIVYFCGRYDIDNGLKALLDILKMPTDRSPYGMGLIEDDSQIWRFVAPFEKVQVKHRYQEKLEFTLSLYEDARFLP